MKDEDRLKKMKNMVEVNIKINKIFEKNVRLILEKAQLSHSLPDEIINQLIEPMFLSYESSKVNVKNIENLPEDGAKYNALSNFIFGKMFGKTELLLEIFYNKRLKEDVLK